MTQINVIPIPRRMSSAGHANPLRLLKITLVVSSGALMLIILASSPKFQAALSREAHAASKARAEPAETRIKIQIHTAQTTTHGFVSPSPEKTPTGTAWYGTNEITMQDAGELFSAQAEQSWNPIVSGMPRSRIPVRKNGRRVSE
ncbi:hypothetical protein [Tropicibacter sp. Alg240-R139]|uniref:hypothetical protein n=1 Tax=Tropicibacter sp. Alg240-R139 TaxID=2305991 RepID=UPI0013DF2461|nr:hypothetical protein [Tropicibacter sp. Alg240-R139]